MATKKATPQKKEEIFYAVIPEQYPLETNDEITVYKSIEQGFFDAQRQYDVDAGEDKFVIYEIKRKGIVNIKVDIQLS